MLAITVQADLAGSKHVSGDLVLIISLETYQATSWPRLAYAQTSSKWLLERFREAGIPSERLLNWENGEATLTTLRSRLGKLSERFPSVTTLHILWIGHAWSRAGRNALVCWDTQPDDLEATSLPLTELCNAISKFPCQERVLYLETGRLVQPPIAGKVATDWYIDLDALEAVLPAGAVALTATSGAEVAQLDPVAKRRVWLDRLGRGLSGEAANSEGTITVLGLANYLQEELPRALRQVLSSPATQSPTWLGTQPGLRLRQLPPPKASVLDLTQLRRVVFRAETHQRIKQLRGFQPGHHLPERLTAAAERFLARIAQEDLRDDLDVIFDAIREHLGYKRKDLEAAVETDGTGFIRTPAFDYLVRIRLDPEDPTQAIWQHELTQLSDPDLLHTTGFEAVFGNRFDHLLLEWAEPLDLFALVDRLEEQPVSGRRVRLASDGRACTITLEGFTGAIHLQPEQLRIDGQSSQGCWGLLERFFVFEQAMRTGGQETRPRLTEHE